MNNQIEDRQYEIFEGFWQQSLRARFSYYTASPLRVLKFAFRLSGIGRRNLRVLDIGFGRGDALFHFERSCSIYGLELADSAIRRARRIAEKRGYLDYEFKRPTSAELPYPDDFFDVIILSHVLEHLHDHTLMLREIRRCLRPGRGRAFMIVPLDNWENRLLTEEEMLVREFWTGESVHVRRYNFLTLLSLVEEAGFHVGYALATDHILDWKSAVEENFRRGLRAKLGFIDRIVVAPLINIPLSVMPYWLWKAIDNVVACRGFKPRQALIIASK